MEEKKYLKWYNKVGYGSGDIAGNVKVNERFVPDSGTVHTSV